MKALLLTAGRGIRLKGYTENTPKSLLHVNNQPILFHLVDRIIASGINEFVVVVGFQKEKIINALTSRYPNISFKFIESSLYEKTNTLYSMYLARGELFGEEFIYFHGDVLVNKNILKKLLDIKYKNGAIIDSQKESMQAFGFDDIITRISKRKDALGKALGIYKFSKEASERLFEEAEKIISSGDINAFQSEAINPTILHHRMSLVGTDGLSWFEIDEEDDLIEAEKILNNMLKEESCENVRNMWV